MKPKSEKPVSKQAEIDAANAAYAKKRLEILDARLGQGIGAKRERARLAALIQRSTKG